MLIAEPAVESVLSLSTIHEFNAGWSSTDDVVQNSPHVLPIVEKVEFVSHISSLTNLDHVNHTSNIPLADASCTQKFIDSSHLLFRHLCSQFMNGLLEKLDFASCLQSHARFGTGTNLPCITSSTISSTDSLLAGRQVSMCIVTCSKHGSLLFSDVHGQCFMHWWDVVHHSIL